MPTQHVKVMKHKKRDKRIPSQLKATRNDDGESAKIEIERDYEYEEMVIEHPDIFALTTTKEFTIQKRVKTVYVTHSIPNEPRMFGRKLNKHVPPVVLLHGARFTSSTWETTNTILVSIFCIYQLFWKGMLRLCTTQYNLNSLSFCFCLALYYRCYCYWCCWCFFGFCWVIFIGACQCWISCLHCGFTWLRSF